MADVVILVGQDVPAIREVARRQNLTIIEETIVAAFDSISTETDEVFADAGEISSGHAGACAFARA